MSLVSDIGRLNELLELFSEWALASDLEQLLAASVERLSRVIDFERVDLQLTGPTLSYWSATRDELALAHASPSQLPPAVLGLLQGALVDGVPNVTDHAICQPLISERKALGAICFRTVAPAIDDDVALVAHIASCLGGVVQRLGHGSRSRRQTLDLAEAAEARQAKDQFLALLGHELRNPLAPILAGVELLRDRAGADVPNELRVIERQTHHLARLVEDLLDTSRLVRGSVSLARATVEVSSVVALAGEMIQPLVDAKRLKLRIDVPSTGLCVDVDEHRMAQVITNLLRNAVEHSPSGGAISITGRLEDERVAVEVIDTGDGIDASLMSRIFDAFNQGPRTFDRAAGGLGLGLSIAAGLTEAHGGTICAVSEGPGTGSAFTVRLPHHKPLSATPLTQQRPVGGASLTVVLVDDNRDAVDLLAELLELAGHRVWVAYDGEQALVLMDRERPDVAVVDIGLPGINGYEVARSLRAKPDGGPKLIAMTGYGSQHDRDNSRAAGFDLHLVKPVAPSALLATLQTIT